MLTLIKGMKFEKPYKYTVTWGKRYGNTIDLVTERYLDLDIAYNRVADLMELMQLEGIASIDGDSYRIHGIRISYGLETE